MARGLRSYVVEVEEQPRALREFSRSSFPKGTPGSVFVGAGDSYSAAMAACYSSRGSCIAIDPYHLASEPEVARGADVYLISVSGRTASNLAAAREVARVARRTTAITADDESKLAGLVDRVVKLPISYSPRTPGLLAYSLSLLAVLKIASGKGECDFEAAYRAARGDEEEVAWGRGVTYFLGNALAHPAAVYAAAKAYELPGARAHAELLEEFSHLELFSLMSSDAVNTFAAFDPLDASGRLSRALGSQGYRSHVVPSRGSSEAERLFHAVFVGQLSALRRAGELGLTSASFQGADRRLAVSDAMIY